LECGLTLGAADGSSKHGYATAKTSDPEMQSSSVAHGLAIGDQPLDVASMPMTRGGGSSGYVSSSLPTGGVLGAWEAGWPRAPLVIHPPALQPPGPPVHSPRPSEDAPKAPGSLAAFPLEQQQGGLVEFPSTANSASSESLRPVGLGMPTPAHYKPATRTRGRAPSLVRVPSSSLLGFSEDASPSFDSTPTEQQAAAAVIPEALFVHPGLMIKRFTGFLCHFECDVLV